MRKTRVFGQLMGVQGMVIGDVTMQPDPDGDGEVLVVSVRTDARTAGRCAQCRRSCPGYDAGVGTRRWRTVDTGITRTFLEAAAPRVKCPEHGVLVVHVPVGPARREMHLSVGGHLRVAGQEHGIDGGDGVPATVLADRRGDRRPGRAGPHRENRSTRRPDPASGSTKSPTGRDTDTSPAWSTTTPVAWCGPTRAATRTP